MKHKGSVITVVLTLIICGIMLADYRFDDNQVVETILIGVPLVQSFEVQITDSGDTMMVLLMEYMEPRLSRQSNCFKEKMG